MTPYVVAAGAFFGALFFGLWRLDRAGTAVMAAAVAEPAPQPLRHEGATEAGLQLAPAAEHLDPFDPRWKPVVWAQPTMFDALAALERPDLTGPDVESFTGAWNRAALQARIGAR